MRTFLLPISAALVLGLGCTGETPEPSKVETLVTGTLYFGLSAEPRPVEVHDYLDGRRSDVLCAVESDPTGAWACDLGPLFGAFYAETRADGAVPLRAVVDGVEQGRGLQGVQITPVTHFTMTYAEGLVRREGLSFENALAKARRLLHMHFGGVDGRFLLPVDPTETETARLADPEVLGVLLEGLSALAAELAEAQGQSPGGVLSVWTLVAALDADLESDGLFDGRADGLPVKFGEVALSADTLRADYARAMLAFLGSDRNRTRFTPADFEAVAQAIGTNTSELFPGNTTPGPLDREGPSIDLVEVFVAGGTAPLSGEGPVGGMIEVSATATDRSGVRALSIAVEDRPGVVFGLGQAFEGYSSWRLDSAQVPDGARGVVVTAEDVHGNRSTARRELVFDNTPPNLLARAAGVVQSGEITVSGNVSDVIGPVTRIELSGGAASASIDAPGPEWSAMLTIACDANWSIEVRAFDAAGNVAATSVPVRCDSTPPILLLEETTFQSEANLDAIYSADGMSVAYVQDGPATPVVLGPQTSWPVTLTKYFNRLDEGSDNVPRIHFLTNDGQGGATASYRYLIDGQEVRPSTALLRARVDALGNHFELPLSYQTLDPRLGRGDGTELHRIELRAVDDAGNASTLAVELRMVLRSPPVWFGNCALAPTLSVFSLPGRSLREIYSTRPSTDVMVGQLRYATGLPQVSLAAQDGVIAALSGGEVTSRILTLSEDRHPGPTVTPNVQDLCFPYPQHRFYGFGGTLEPTCRPGVFPAERVRHQRATDGPVNDEVPDPAEFLVNLSGQVVPALAGGEYRVQRDRGYGLGALVSQPELRVGGQVYDWSENLGLPPGFTAGPFSPRYRVFYFDRQGLSYDGTFDAPVWQRFAAEAFISSFEIEVAPVVVTARHETLPIAVEVVATPACAQALRYTTSL